MTKNNHQIKFVVFLLILLIGAVSAAAQGSYTKISDLAYAGTSLSTQKLDLYVPAGATTATPVVIWIHGGGWTGGDKALNTSSFQLRYAQNGYAVASINYRLSSQAIFPAQIHDCKAAIRWLRANAAQYNLDTTKFAVWGSSAGGHLAALLGTSNDVVEMEGAVGGNSQIPAACRQLSTGTARRISCKWTLKRQAKAVVTETTTLQIRRSRCLSDVRYRPVQLRFSGPIR